MTIGLLIILPLLGAGAVLAQRRRPGLFTSLALTILAAELALAIQAAALSTAAEATAAWSWGPSLALQLEVTGLSRGMVVLVPAIALPVTLHAGTSLRDDPGLSRLLTLLVAFVGAMELLVVAADFLTLLIGWEMVGAISWALIAHEWEDPGRPRAALQAFLTTRAADLGLYAAAGLTLAAAGSLRFTALANVHGPALGLIAAGVLLAAAAKSAQVPFAPWLFPAMEGPTPASALLHSATMVAAGAYLLARLSPLFTRVDWFGSTVAALGLATALAAGVVATLQREAKRVLAASTSAQYGLMLVAIGAGVPAAAGLHLVTHAAFKALLFLGAGMLIHAAGTGDLGRLRPAGARPRIATAFGVGILALAGVPPLGAAYTKDQIVAAAAERSPALALGVVLAGFLSGLYAARLYLLASGPDLRVADATPQRGERVSVTVLATLSLALGIFWVPGAGNAAAAFLGGRLARASAWELLASLLGAALAAWSAWAAWRRGVLVTLALPERHRERLADWLGIPTLATRLVVAPATRASRALAAFDDHAVDAGIRATASLADTVSRVLAWWGERTADGLVRALVRLTGRAALRSRLADEGGVDAAVEHIALGIRRVGARARAVQTGLAHEYYAIVAIGTVLAVLAALFRWQG